MTMMQFIPHPQENLIAFRELRRGETFRYPNGDRMYIVTNSAFDHGAAVNLSSGEIYAFENNKAVRRVEVIAQWKTVGVH